MRIVYCLILLSLSVPCGAGTLFVDADAAGANDGSSWANAFPSLQNALAAAKARNTDGNSGNDIDQIWVAEGIYKPDQGAGQTVNDPEATFELLSHVALYGGFAGSEAALGDRDVSGHVTVLSGQINTAAVEDNSYHVITSNAGITGAVLDGFTITGGYADAQVGYPGNGGGLFCFQSAPTIRNCTFTDNIAAGRYYGRGGAIYSLQAQGMIIADCTFDGNTAKKGGAIFHFQCQDVTIVNCTFTDNYAYDDAGGAILNDSCSRIGMVNCLLGGNFTTKIGGAVCNVGMANGHFFTNCTLAGNASTDISFDAQTGGIYSKGSSTTLTIANSILWGNTDRFGTRAASQLAGGGKATVTYSCIQDDDPNDGSIPFGGVNNSNIDLNPRFVLDPSDGGDGWRVGNNDIQGNLHLRPDSPCIDIGSNAAVPDDIADLDEDDVTDEEIPYDLDEQPRRVDGNADGTATVDRGTYEALSANAIDLAAGGAAVTLNPGGGANDPATDALVVFQNLAGSADNTVQVVETPGDTHASVATFSALGSTLTMLTSLNDGEFFATVAIPFDQEDVGMLDPLLVDLRYFDTTALEWKLAVSANTGGAGSRYSETGAAAPTLATLTGRNLGDYGVYWNSTTGKGFSWANVDHATDFAATVKGNSQSSVDPDDLVTLSPLPGNVNPLMDVVIVFENTSDTTNAAVEIYEAHNDLVGQHSFQSIGQAKTIVDTTLNDGDFKMTLIIPFDDEDLSGANPLLVDLQFYNTGSSSWELAVSANTSGAGTRWSEQDDDQPSLETLRTRPLGDYGVYWDAEEEQGLVWANVDHTTDFLAGWRIGDFEPDGDVDLADLMFLAEQWLQDSCLALSNCGGADFDGSGQVDLTDFGRFSESFPYSPIGDLPIRRQ
ncbi:MAG: right-handed parallel beta-helix repeat-containing protein [Sedimentisphaerales bacterium]|nr:right-handed parallel beta-helix repeat-containing protein [Sedimentisphaerales bacterium]